MKILHMAESFGAGVYSFISEVANFQVLQGNEVIIIYSERKETPKNFADDFNPGVRFIHIDMCRSINPIKDIKAFLKLKKIIKDEKPDIIHLHSSKAGFIGRAVSKFSRYKIPVFYNPHGFSFLMKDVSTLKRKIYFFLEKIASHFGGTIIACSKAEYILASNITKNCVMIKHGINTEKISTAVKSIELNDDSISLNNKNIYTIGTVGRICSAKHPALFNKIAESLPGHSFVWIGSGDLANELTSPNIAVTGWLNRNDVIKQMLHIDIFIMTSLWEGLPISLIDAMYLKKPCIVTNIEVYKEIIDNGENGFIANTADDFIKYIKQMEDLDLRNKILQNAFSYIIQNHDIKRMNNEYLTLYKKSFQEEQNKYKIMHLLSTESLSGAEKVALEICKNLNYMKFEPVAVCKGCNLYNAFSSNNIKTYIIDIGKLNPVNILRLRQVVKYEKIDLIHAHDVRASVAAGISRVAARTKVVSHIHVNYRWLKSFSIYKFIDYLFRRKYDLSIACSDNVCNTFLQYIKCFDKSKIISIRNCINFNEIVSKKNQNKVSFKIENNIPADKYIFGFAGRLIDVKGVDLLIKSFGMFCKIYNNSLLLIVGDGIEIDNLKKLVLEYGISKSVIFTGYVNNVYNYIDIMDAFILPSMREGMPVAVMEAMALGKIVIVTKTDGIPEIVKDGHTGIILNERTPECLLDAMVYVYGSKEKVNIIGDNASDFIKINCDIKTYIEKIEKVYTSLLDKV